MLQRCSDLLNGCGRVCDEFSKACEGSVGRKFFLATCQNDTIAEMVTFLQKQTVIENKTSIKWESLAENPLKITNYVMSAAFNGHMFHRYTERVRQIIYSVRTLKDKRTVRTGALFQILQPQCKGVFRYLHSCASNSRYRRRDGDVTDKTNAANV
ncbi:hypothetical protein SNE40_016611 [Patella caerulea]|uniref:Uncharacterized protein n=1 Tax=Patella caerulea TaxID=87958 RepID=A0AAN8PE38_PATCE